MKNLPKRIYLNIGDGVPDDANFHDLSEVTWSEERMFDNDIEYVRKSEWIPVREQLPEPMQCVLAWIGDEAFVCWYLESGRFMTTLSCHERYVKDITGAKFHLSSDRADVTDVVTHWMSIVEPDTAKEVEE